MGIEQRESINITSSELGRQLAARREIVHGNCICCGKEFIGTKKRQYCSDVCRVRGKRQRKKDISMEARKEKKRQVEKVSPNSTEITQALKARSDLYLEQLAIVQEPVDLTPGELVTIPRTILQQSMLLERIRGIQEAINLLNTPRKSQ